MTIHVSVSKEELVDGTTAEREWDAGRKLVDADVRENTLILEFE